MSDSSTRAPGYERRTLARNVCFAQFVMAYGFAGALWWSRTDHQVKELGLIGLPVACSAAFLLTIVVGFPLLCPWPRLHPIVAVTMPLMFCAILLAVTALLTARRSALIEPSVAQQLMAAWLDPYALGILFSTQAILLLFVAFLFRPSGASTPPPC